MTQVQRPERRSPQHWAAVVKEYTTSGQSQRQFCGERGIGQSSLRYWRRRLGQGPSAESAQTGMGTRLVAVKVFEDTPALAHSGLVVVARGGVRIEVARDFDAGTLARVVASLEAVA